jgi:hypothetical protein
MLILGGGAGRSRPAVTPANGYHHNRHADQPQPVTQINHLSMSIDQKVGRDVTAGGSHES